MPFVPTSQGKLFYAQQGEGTPTVIGIHGAGGTHQHWGYQMHVLRREVRCITFDLPGHGRSPPPGCRSISDYCSALVAALDELQLSRVVLAGHSMGGAVALWTALTQPQRVAGLCLISTGARLPVMPALFDHLKRGEFATVVQLIVHYSYGPGVSAELRTMGEQGFLQTNSDVFAGDLIACATYDAMELAKHIALPTCIICGDADQITPLKFSHYLHQQITGSTLVILPGIGHMSLLEQPDGVNQAMLDFICQCKNG